MVTMKGKKSTHSSPPPYPYPIYIPFDHKLTVLMFPHKYISFDLICMCLYNSALSTKRDNYITACVRGLCNNYSNSTRYMFRLLFFLTTHISIHTNHVHIRSQYNVGSQNGCRGRYTNHGILTQEMEQHA